MIYEIIVDSGETANKCTIAPLASRTDFHLFRVKGDGPLGPLSAPVLLHHEGQCLTTLRETVSPVPALASVDCVWRRLPKLLNRIEWKDGKQPALAKIPEGFRTVYPRVGANGTDPQGGLATIEALFVAAALLGNYDPTLLSQYHFARRFIELNVSRFFELGVESNPEAFPLVPSPARNAMSRRQNRGRAGKP